VPETANRDVELLIADVEDISWEDLIQEMLPDGGPMNNIIPLPCCSAATCDDGIHCDSGDQ
jgi:hypothetical protein